jgi:glycosyltransferase involved in cell wall biosynthesis
MIMEKGSIAVLIPCYNEEVTIEKVIRDFREALPEATIYVYDNNSTDKTAAIAARQGAIVRRESRQGKGFVVQAMFRDIDADFYLLVDGDDTYPASHAKKLLEPVMSGEYDMSVGTRLANNEDEAFPRFHVFGNYLTRSLINRLFRMNLRDIFSGYRCFSRQFVKACPVMSRGFEIETELTLQALNKRFKIFECDIPYGARPEGSISKLSTFKDGLIVLNTIFRIFRDYKPLVFFFTLGSIGLLAGALSGWVVVKEFIDTRYITHVPLAIFAVGSVLVSFLFYGVGLILDTINRRFNEIFDVQIKN